MILMIRHLIEESSEELPGEEESLKSSRRQEGP